MSLIEIPRVEVKLIEELPHVGLPPKWGLCVNGIIIAESKNRFDADHGVVMFKKALGVLDDEENITELCNI